MLHVAQDSSELESSELESRVSNLEERLEELEPDALCSLKEEMKTAARKLEEHIDMEIGREGLELATRRLKFTERSTILVFQANDLKFGSSAYEYLYFVV